MTLKESEKLLEELIKDIEESRLGPKHKIYLKGLIDCIKYYLSQIYCQLPVKR